MTETDPTFLALLRGVLAAPWDDTPRLVFADWLEGDADPPQPERAEFVRVQCELAGLERRAGNWRDGEWAAYHRRLKPRERELLDTRDPSAPERHLVGTWMIGGRVWTYGSNDRRHLYYPTAPDGSSGYGVEISRGFVSAVTCPADVWLRHADEIYWHPEQTVACKGCDGKGEWFDGYDRWKDCRSCDGTGRVPRECPPTAQPLEWVVLTGWGREIYDLQLTAVDRADPSKGHTSPRWPGVVFTLPAAS